MPIHVILHTIKGVERLPALLADVRGLLPALLAVVGPVGPVGLVGGRVPRVARLGAVGVEPLHAGEVVLGEALLVVAVLRHVDVGGAVGAFDLAGGLGRVELSGHEQLEDQERERERREHAVAISS